MPVVGGTNEIRGSDASKTIDPIDKPPLELTIDTKLPPASKFPIFIFGSARVPLPSVAPCAINTYRSPAVRFIECKSNVSGVEIWLETGTPFATIGAIAILSSLKICSKETSARRQHHSVSASSSQEPRANSTTLKAPSSAQRTLNTFVPACHILSP